MTIEECRIRMMMMKIEMNTYYGLSGMNKPSMKYFYNEYHKAKKQYFRLLKLQKIFKEQ